MDIQVVGTAYGRPALVELHRLISSLKRDDPLSPVSVLVPSNYVGVSTRRILASGQMGPIAGHQGVAGIDLLTTYRLAELLGAPRLAAMNRRPLSTPVVAAVIRGVLNDTPTIFSKVKDHPSTEKALVRVHRELRDLGPEQLDQLASARGNASDVVAIHRETNQRLTADWYDEFDLFDAAATVVDERPHLASERGHIIVHLPQTMTAAGVRLLRRVASHVPVTVLAGITGDDRADLGVTRLLDRLGAATPSVDVKPAAATKIITLSDADDEVRTVIRDVVGAMLEGESLESMAIVYGSDEPYARLLDEQLAAAGIPRNGASVKRVDESVVGRTVLALLSLPDHDFRRSDVMALLSSAPILESATGRLLAPVSAWERLSRKAGIIDGADQWQVRLDRLLAEARADVARAQGDPDDRRHRRAETTISQGERLMSFTSELITAVDTATVPASWAAKTDWLRNLTSRYLGDVDERSDWPDIEQLAADKLDDALDRLAGLDQVEQSPSLSTFRRTLELELESGLGRTGAFGEGVFVGRIGQALGVDLKRVFVLGMAEGVLPSRHREDSLLPDRARARTHGGLALAMDRIDEEHRGYLAALAGADRERTLYFPRGDLRRSSERMPSRWLLDTVEALHGVRVWSDDLSAVARSERDWITEVPSFVGGLRATSFPATDQEYELRSLLDHHEAGLAIEDHHLITDDPAFSMGVDLLRSRASNRFTRFDGNLTGVVTADGVRLSVMSPTRLETWARCPHRYLMQHVMRVEPVEQPEALLRISPLDRGSLVHAALDEFLSKLLASGAMPDSSQAFDEHLTGQMLEIAEELCDDYERRGLVGKQLFWRRDKRDIIDDLLETLRRDFDRDHRGQVIASELGFGIPGSDRPPIVHTLPDGREVAFRGSADRLERTADGKLIVVDYKTGANRGFVGIDKEDKDPTKEGTKLQLPVYALAARAAHGDATSDVHAAYWFTSAKGGFNWIGYDLNDRVMTRFDEVLTVIVDGISGGVFPAKPVEDHNSYFIDCDYCDPDGLGTLDRRREWERKRSQPELASYSELAEPQGGLDV